MADFDKTITQVSQILCKCVILQEHDYQKNASIECETHLSLYMSHKMSQSCHIHKVQGRPNLQPVFS